MSTSTSTHVPPTEAPTEAPAAEPCIHFLTPATCAVCKRHAADEASPESDALQTRTVVALWRLSDREVPTALVPFVYVDGKGRDKGTRATVAKSDHGGEQSVLRDFSLRGVDLPGERLTSTDVVVSVTDDVETHADVSATVTLAPTDRGTLEGSARFEHAGQWIRVDVSARPVAASKGRREGWNLRAVARKSRRPRPSTESVTVDRAATVDALA